MKATKTQWEDNHPKVREIDEKVLEMTVVDNEPFNIVTHEGFQNLVRVLEPKYRLKQPKFYRNKLEELYLEVSEELFGSLPKDVHIALTTDAWSAPNQAVALLSLTGHYIDEDIQRKNFVVGAMPIEDAHACSI